MKVQFKNTSQALDCTEPIEQGIFKSGLRVGWAIMFHIRADVSSSDIDNIITPDNISELAFTKDEGYPTAVITGYTSVTACTIRHKKDATVVEVQFTKTTEQSAENKAE